jgi:hypothetical protein
MKKLSEMDSDMTRIALVSELNAYLQEQTKLSLTED